jgi:hypothetical protein
LDKAAGEQLVEAEAIGNHAIDILNGQISFNYQPDQRIPPGIPPRSTVDFGESATVTFVAALLVISVLDPPSSACHSLRLLFRHIPSLYAEKPCEEH